MWLYVGIFVVATGTGTLRVCFANFVGPFSAQFARGFHCPSPSS